MTPAAERPLGELFSDLAHQTGTLVRQEVQLARVEMTEKAQVVARNAGVIAAGGALIHVAVLALATAVIAILSTVFAMPLWLAALLTAFTVGLGGYALVRKGISGLTHIDPKPAETMKTLEENKLWVKNELSR